VSDFDYKSGKPGDDAPDAPKITDDNNFPTIPLPGGHGLMPFFPRPGFDPGPSDWLPPAHPWNPAPGDDGPQPDKWWEKKRKQQPTLDRSFWPKPADPQLPPGWTPKPPTDSPWTQDWTQDPNAPSTTPSLLPPLQMPQPPQWNDRSSTVPKLQLDPAALVPPAMPPDKDDGT
jgi:hypothetical protein